LQSLKSSDFQLKRLAKLSGRFTTLLSWSESFLNDDKLPMLFGISVKLQQPEQSISDRYFRFTMLFGSDTRLVHKFSNKVWSATKYSKDEGSSLIAVFVRLMWTKVSAGSKTSGKVFNFKFCQLQFENGAWKSFKWFTTGKV
jgi:hypothetical protein